MKTLFAIKLNSSTIVLFFSLLLSKNCIRRISYQRIRIRMTHRIMSRNFCRVTRNFIAKAWTFIKKSDFLFFFFMKASFFSGLGTKGWRGVAHPRRDTATLFSLPDLDASAAARFNAQTMKKNVKWRGEVPLPFSQSHCCPVTVAPGNV